MAEELAFEGSFGHAAGVDRDQGHAGARRGGVKQTRDDLLARAVLAGDEDVGVGGADLRDQLEDRLHGGRAGDKVRHAFGAEQAVFEFQLAGAAQRLVQLGVHADEGEQPLVLPRLLDKVARAALDAFDGQVDVAPRRHHDHREARIEFLDMGEQIEAFLAGGGVARVVQVDEHDIVVALAQRLQKQLRRAHAIDVDPLRLEQQLDGFKNVRLIVGNQNPDFFLLSGDGMPPAFEFSNKGSPSDVQAVTAGVEAPNAT